MDARRGLTHIVASKKYLGWVWQHSQDGKQWEVFSIEMSRAIEDIYVSRRFKAVFYELPSAKKYLLHFDTMTQINATTKAETKVNRIQSDLYDISCCPQLSSRPLLTSDLTSDLTEFDSQVFGDFSLSGSSLTNSQDQFDNMYISEYAFDSCTYLQHQVPLPVSPYHFFNSLTTLADQSDYRRSPYAPIVPLDNKQPLHWCYEDMMPSTVNQYEVTLSSLSDEYVQLVRLLKISARDVEVLAISKVVNPILYRKFSSYCRLLGETKPQYQQPNLLYLFHGTHPGNIRNICEEGFHSSYGTRSVWGKGNYFARDACYSLNTSFSPFAVQTGNTKVRGLEAVPVTSTGPIEYQCLFVARVCLGDVALGKRDCPKPFRVDTTINSFENPNIFVTYENGQSYPEFLIYVKYKNPQYVY